MKKILVVLIILIAFILRIYNIGTIPSGLQNDEASFLVNAISIAQTGKDEDGKSFPLILRSYIDPKPALYSYLEIPFINVLGVTPVAARLPAVLFGVISIFFFSLILKQFLDEKTALIGMALLSISPWHIDLSRGTQEVIMAFCFSIVTIYLFLLLHKVKSNPIIYVSFFLLLVLSLYSYPSVKVFLPIALVIYTFIEIFTKKIMFKRGLILLGIVILGVVILVPMTDPVRFKAVSIFTNQKTQLVVDEKIRTATNYAPGIAIRIFNNKFLGYGYDFLSNYTVYFSGNFLFFGENQPQRYQIPFTGILFPIEVIFLFLGIFSAFSNKKQRQSAIFMLILLLVAPIPAAVTSQETPSITRSFPMVIPLFYFISVGMVSFLEIAKRKQTQIVLISVLSFVYIYSFSYFWFNYTILQGSYRPWHRNYEDTLLVSAVAEKENRYKTIYLSNSSYTYFVFANKISIQELQKSYPRRFNKMFDIGKYVFVNEDCYILPRENSLFVIKSATCELSNKQKKMYKRVGIVRFKDNNPAYTFYQYIPPKLTVVKVK